MISGNHQQSEYSLSTRFPFPDQPPPTGIGPLCYRTAVKMPFLCFFSLYSLFPKKLLFSHPLLLCVLLPLVAGPFPIV